MPIGHLHKIVGIVQFGHNFDRMGTIIGNYPPFSLLSFGGIRPGGAAAGGEIPPKLAAPFDGVEFEIGGGENGAGFGKPFDASVWVTRPICVVDDDRRILLLIVVVGGSIGERDGGDGDS